VHHQKFILGGKGQYLFETQACRRGIYEFAGGNKRSRLGQPCGIPERPHLAPRLVARAGAAVEAVIGGWVQEEGSRVRPPRMVVAQERNETRRLPCLKQLTSIVYYDVTNAGNKWPQETSCNAA
jgi:hypothetical protein